MGVEITNLLGVLSSNVWWTQWRKVHAGSVCNTLSLWLWVETLSYPDQNSVSESDFLLNTELELSLITHYITLSTRVVTESDVFSALLPPLWLSFSTTHLPFLNREGEKNQKHWITVTQFKQKGRNYMIFQLIKKYNRYCSKLLELLECYMEFVWNVAIYEFDKRGEFDKNVEVPKSFLTQKINIFKMFLH